MKYIFNFITNTLKSTLLLKQMFLKDIKTKYIGSVLGPIWAVLTPFYYIILYTIIFSTILKVRFSQGNSTSSFVVYFLAGLIPWLFFQEGVLRGSNTFLENAHIIKKVRFPIEICINVVILSSGVNFILFMILYYGYLLLIGILKPISVFLIIVPFTIELMIILGFCLAFGSLSIFFRDLQQLLPLLLNALFFLTPIVYPSEVIPESLKSFFKINPFYWLIKVYRSVIIEGKLPISMEIIYPFLFSIIIFYIGSAIFYKSKEEFKDLL